MLKILSVDGVDYVCFIDRANGDGGRVINYLSPAKDGGEYYNFRHWFSDPSDARTDFDKIGADTVLDRATKAKAIDEPKIIGPA